MFNSLGSAAYCAGPGLVGERVRVQSKRPGVGGRPPPLSAAAPENQAEST